MVKWENKIDCFGGKEVFKYCKVNFLLEISLSNLEDKSRHNESVTSFRPLLNGPISSGTVQRSGILHIVRDP